MSYWRDDHAMTVPSEDSTGIETSHLRERLARELEEDGVLVDHPEWRPAIETVPRHLFVPGFYLPTGQISPQGLEISEPITAKLDYERWLDTVYTDTSLATQIDGDEPNWDHPEPYEGGTPTSSSTMPSLVVGMWADADLQESHDVLEVGTGTGYSTALACERFGSDAITSIEVDSHRLDQAWAGLSGCGYAPRLAAADGLYGYWPRAPFDRIVAACSVRTIPPAWLAQVRPGGKILTTLGGWLYGHARVLLTVHDDGTAAGPLLPGTISFMIARAHQKPWFGNPGDWASLPGEERKARYGPGWNTKDPVEAFYIRFLAQCAVPNAQVSEYRGATHLIDAVSGSAATLTPQGEDWHVRQAGPVRLWDQIETVLDAYHAAGRPGPEAFRLTIDETGQYVRHPQLPSLKLPDTAGVQ